jgi:hypothetical protein
MFDRCSTHNVLFRIHVNVHAREMILTQIHKDDRAHA